MLTYMEKLEFLRSLRKGPVDLTLADRMIGYASDDVLRRPVISSLVRELTSLDAYISVMHGVLSQEEWDEVVSEYDTPIEGDHTRLREQIRTFLSAYRHVDRAICGFKVRDVLNAFRDTLASRTRNVQFLLFRLCRSHPREVFEFLFKLSRTNPTVFLPYLCSLLVRCKVDPETKDQCVGAYIEYVRSLRRSDSIQYVAACQCLLYILCFRREAAASAGDVVEWVFSSGVVGYMNRSVVRMFCELFGRECKTFLSYDHDCLYFFPFDQPVLDEISDLVSDFYIHFER